MISDPNSPLRQVCCSKYGWCGESKSLYCEDGGVNYGTACTCEHGLPDTVNSCPKNRTNFCASCDAGFVLDGRGECSTRIPESHSSWWPRPWTSALDDNAGYSTEFAACDNTS